ncbi:MAG TPA: hypothetical protein VGC16_04985 [Rhizomicrobium sp.]
MKSAAIPFLLAFLVLPAVAQDKKEDAGKKGGKPGTNVDMPFLMAPLAGADGKLTGYAYLSNRLTATTDANALAVRDKLAFIQDAMVRDVNAAGVAGGDPEKVDIPAVEQRLLADAARVMGAGKVKLITVCTIQVAPLHPVQTPAKVTPATMPGTPSPKNPEKSRCES